jgi:hypothetical protein
MITSKRRRSANMDHWRWRAFHKIDLSSIVRALVALGLLAAAPAPPVGLPAGTSGLVCTGPSHSHLRINIDLDGMRFQKDGFPAFPILAADADHLILSRFSNEVVVILASIDRHSLIYTTQSQGIAGGWVERADYQCKARAPFKLAANR